MGVIIFANKMQIVNIYFVYICPTILKMGTNFFHMRNNSAVHIFLIKFLKIGMNTANMDMYINNLFLCNMITDCQKTVTYVF